MNRAFHLIALPLRLLVLLSSSLLIATWIGYPLVVWLVARLRSRPDGRRPGAVIGAAGLPTVSAIVASREPDSAIVSRVENLLASAYPAQSLDVVVAIDASREPATPGSVLSGHARVTVVAGDGPGGKAGALNAAVRAAGGELLVFTDTAQRFEPGTIARLAGALVAAPDTAAVSGALQIAEREGHPSAAGLYWRFERWLREMEAHVHSPVGVTGAVYAMRRAEWVELPAGLILDDLYVPMAQVLRGRRIGFCREAVALDPRHVDHSGEYRRKTRTLTGVFQLCRLLPGVLSPSRNPVWLQFVFHKLLRLATPWLLALLVMASGAWLLLALPLRTALFTLGAGALAIALVLAAFPRVRRLLREVLAMQAAVVQATRNAARGEWDVWHR